MTDAFMSFFEMTPKSPRRQARKQPVSVSIRGGTRPRSTLSKALIDVSQLAGWSLKKAGLSADKGVT
jgi:hypothetical protein